MIQIYFALNMFNMNTIFFYPLVHWIWRVIGELPVQKYNKEGRSCWRTLLTFFCLVFVIQLKEYKVIGRMMPTETSRTPKLYQMRIFAPDKPTAKSRFWYFCNRLRKMKKTQGEIVCCQHVMYQFFLLNFMRACCSLNYYVAYQAAD